MSYRIDCKRKARALPKEKRQKILDLILNSKTIGEAAELTNATADEVVGVIIINLETTKITKLNSITV